MNRPITALGTLAVALALTACASDQGEDQTSTPSPAAPSNPGATTSQPSLKSSTTELPPSPQKTPPGGIGGTG